MRQLLLRAAWAALFACSLSVSASELRISFGNDSLRGEFLQALGEPVADSAPTLHAGVLYREESDSDGTLGHAGLVIYGDAGSEEVILQAGIGGRLYLLSTDPDVNGAALAMGGAVLGRLPGVDRLGAFGGLWYAPRVSAFGELDRALEINLGIEYQLLRQAALSLGWRRIEFKTQDGPSFDFEDSAFIGFKFLF
jgi:hypothetical protein